MQVDPDDDPVEQDDPAKHPNRDDEARDEAS
jgi:hypothetical protein